MRKTVIKASIVLTTITIVVASLYLFSASEANALEGIRRTVNFQGKLVANTGLNVADAGYSVVFTIYDRSSSGTALWTETQTVTVTDGIFQVELGSVSAIPADFNFNWDGLYLGVKVGADDEMTPRIRLTAVPYAFNAEKVSGLTVQDASGNASTSGTLRVANEKTITLNNSLTFSGTDATVFTFPNATGTVATLDAAQELTNKTIGSTGLVFSGATTDITTGTNETLTLAANGTGNFVFAIDFDSGLTMGTVLGSNPENEFPLLVRSGIGANAAVAIDQLNSGDIFTASASGATVFTITNEGGFALGSVYDEGDNGECLKSGGIGAGMTWATCGGGGLFSQGTGFAYLTTATDDLIIGGTTVAAASFHFDESAGNLYLGTNESLNGILTFYSSGVGITDPSIAADASGNLNLSAPDGEVVLGSGTGNITIDPGNDNFIVDLTGIGNFYVQRAGSTFATFADTGNELLLTGGSLGGDAVLVLDQIGASSNDIFSASASGATKFKISNTGSLWIPNEIYLTARNAADSADIGIIRLDSGNKVGFGTNLASFNVDGDVGLLNQSDLRFYDSDSSHYVGFQSAGAVGTSFVWTLPAADASGCFQSDGGGLISISSCGAGGFSGEVDDTTNDALTFTSDDASPPDGTFNSIFRDNSGDMNINTITGKTLNVQIAGADEYNFGGTALAMNGNNLTGLGTNLSAAAGLTVGTTSNGDLTLEANGTGNINLSGDFNTQVLIGASGATTEFALFVNNSIGSNASLAVNNINSSDIFTASASGATVFTLTNSGGFALGASYDEGDNGECLLSGGAAAGLSWGSCGAGGFSGEVDDTTNDALTFSSDDASPPTNTDVSIFRDNSGDLNLNVLTSKAFNVQVNSTDEYNFGSTALAMNGNNITGLGTNLTAAAGLTVGTGSNGNLTLSPNGSGDVVISGDADTNLQVTFGAAPGVDMAVISNTGFATTTTGADGLQIDYAVGNISSGNNAGLRINVTSTGTSTQDVLGLDIGNLTGAHASVTETGIRIGTGWDRGLVIESGGSTNSGLAYLGDGRPTKRVTLSPEYSGAVLTPYYGAGTDSNIIGSMTSDADTTQGTSIRNYYQWVRTTDATQHFYTVAVRVKLPEDFDAWAPTDALTVSYRTESATNTISDLDVYVFNENHATVVASSTNNASTSWTTVSIDDSVLDDGASSEWDAAGETAVIYMRMGSASSNYVQIGDIVLSYLAKF